MRIELAPELETRFRTALREAGRREIGGMLMAEQLAPGTFRVVDFSLDPLSGSHTAFRRDPKLHQKTLDEFFRAYWPRLPAIQLSRRMALASVLLSSSEH